MAGEQIIMAKQKLEGIFSRSVKENTMLYGFKLHNNPLAHQQTPADFIVHNRYGRTNYVECKECKINSKGGAIFGFDRVTQEGELATLDSLNYNIKAHILISFQGRTMKDSKYYLFDLQQYDMLKRSVNKKSANMKDFEQFPKLELNKLKGSILDVSRLAW